MYYPKYFTLYELCKPHEESPTNYLDSFSTVENLSRLGRFLDEMRESLSHPVKVNSGFRNRRYNESHGGVPNSYHVRGCAADVVMLGAKDGVSPIWNYLAHRFGFSTSLPSFEDDTCELILYPTFVHIAITPNFKFK